MNKLLINEEPLVVLPSLAVSIGLNDAMFLQQVHYWTNRSKHIKDGSRWIYNTYEEWNKQFPFWSVSTIKRIIKDLKDRDLIKIGNFNKVGYDRTNWYTINYSTLNKIAEEISSDEENLEGIDTIESELDKEEVFEEKPVRKAKSKDPKALKLDHNTDPEFNEFWNVYPKKVSKKQAYQPFKRVRKDHDLSRIIVGTVGYANDIRKKQTDFQFVKNPSTFLNNESFLDYLNQPDPNNPQNAKPKQMLMGIGEM